MFVAYDKSLCIAKHCMIEESLIYNRPKSTYVKKYRKIDELTSVQTMTIGAGLYA